MISEKELIKAIAETEGMPTSFQNCEKLAVFYTILNHIRDEEQHFSRRSGDSEFLSVISNKDINAVMSVLDELMQTLDVVEHKLYQTTIDTLKNI